MRAQGGVRLEGLAEVMRGLDREVRAIEQRTGAGLLEAAIHIRRDMHETPPTIPIDTGNLNASWFTTLYKGSRGPVLLFGFTANYAVWVHEVVDAQFKRPGAGAKFLEKALIRNRARVLEIIANSVRR